MKAHLTMEKPTTIEHQEAVDLLEIAIECNKYAPGKKGRVEALESFLVKYQAGYAVAQ